MTADPLRRRAKRLGLPVVPVKRLRPSTTCPKCAGLIPGDVAVERHRCRTPAPVPVPVVDGGRDLPPVPAPTPPRGFPDATPPPATPDECPGCREAIAYLQGLGSTTLWVHCDDCGASVRLQRRKAKRVVTRRDDARAWRDRIAEMCADLALVARWSAHWTVPAFAPSDGGGGGASGGGGGKPAATERGDVVNERHDEMRTARVLADRLEDRRRAARAEAPVEVLDPRAWVLPDGDGYTPVPTASGRTVPSLLQRAVAVLDWVCERCGLQRLDKVDLAELVGEAFAPARTVDGWRQGGDLRDMSATHGRPLVRLAAACWLGLALDTTTNTDEGG